PRARSPAAPGRPTRSARPRAAPNFRRSPRCFCRTVCQTVREASRTVWQTVLQKRSLTTPAVPASPRTFVRGLFRVSPGACSMDVAAARSYFPGTRDRVFLDAACVSLMPVQAAEALERLGQDMLLCPAGDASAHHIALDRTAEQARREAARLIGAR